MDPPSGVRASRAMEVADEGAIRLPDRRGILMVLWGKQAFRKIVLEPGQSITIGRTDRADVVVDDDRMSGQHFSIWFSGKRAVVRDLETPSGTVINGEEASRAMIEHGGFVVAGGTTLQLFLEGFTRPVETPPTVDRLRRLEEVKEALGPVDGHLYAVMDAARNEKIQWLLQESIDRHQNLFEGQPGRVLDDVAPYLVRFTPGSELLDRLLVGGWGDAWGIFVRSAEPLKEVRRHLRRFLMVEDESSYEKLYFRYYDPRVLADFATVITPRQRQELLVGIERVVYEGSNGEPLSLSSDTIRAPNAETA
ncbi:MAG: DUF4123 domain-containing protein [Polyangiaceae bacterium]|nr:DUF4123 domain-containing protein [Polyangiaceae bacterium]